MPIVYDELRKMAAAKLAQETLAVDELIDHLVALHPRQAAVAKMRLFLELAFAEIAEVLGISADSAENDWKFARAWLPREWHGNDQTR